MHYHYETQPIPNPISYYLHQTPSTFHSFEVLVNHFIELFAPFLCMIPVRTVRHIGGMLQIMFQILLIVSGNLSFLNWITIAPALWCFDDSFLLYRLLSSKRPFMTKLLAKNHFRSVINILVFILLLYLSIDPILNLFSKYQRMNSSFDRFNLVNTYGAFGSVGKIRHEVIISGCNKTTINECEQNRGWLEYEFICKPGKINQRPCFSAPYHRRIAWQLWSVLFYLTTNIKPICT